MAEKPRGGWRIVKVIGSEGQTDVFLEARIALLNSTDPPQEIDMQRFGQAVERSIKLCFEVSFLEATREFPKELRGSLDNFSYLNRVPILVWKRYKTHVSVVWRVITSEASRNSEHVIEIQNADELPNVYGRGTIRGSDVKINAKYVDGIISGYDRNTIPHEIGHTLDLLHPDHNKHVFGFLGFESGQYWSPTKQLADSNNVMFSGGSRFMNDSLSVGLTSTQIHRVVDNLRRGTVNR